MNLRQALLNTPPAELSDGQLRAAAAYVVTEWRWAGKKRLHPLFHELARRFGMSRQEIAELTGIRIFLVYAAMKPQSERMPFDQTDQPSFNLDRRRIQPPQ